MWIINNAFMQSYLGKPNTWIVGLAFLLVLAICCGCATLLYGYKKVTFVDTKWCEELATTAQINEVDLIYLDSIRTTELRELMCQPNTFIQPLQLHCVVGDSLVASYFNCFANAGVRRIKWIFENSGHELVDGDCNFIDNSINRQLRNIIERDTEDLLVVIVSSMFKRQSEELVRVALMRSAGFELILVNIDEYYSRI